jgi:hypothetical protein
MFNKNRILAVYALSFSVLALDILFSFIYITFQFSYHTSSIRPLPIQMFLVMVPASDLSRSFGISIDGLSLLSFVLAWFATAALLAHYRKRIGRSKYWVLISVPLIYFLFPFETYVTSALQSNMIYSPLAYEVVYFFIFSATQQVGGILFATVFLTAASTVKRILLRRSLVITAIGMAVLFGSIKVDTLLYAMYPPFGLVTISFVPIGSFLLLVGIIVSARFISQDSEIRKELYKSAEGQMQLLRSIGVAQMEKELEERARSLSKQFGEGQQETPQEEDVKQILHDVLTELHSKGDKRK